jgi:transketolase
MIEVNKLNSKIYSKLGQSGSLFGIGLIEAQKENKQLFVLSADMAKPAGLNRFISRNHDMFINVGIAEQNLIGIAAGMASENKKVLVTAQACFISMRSFEQIRQYMGYMDSNIIAVGISSGFSLTFFGNTHYAIEDISLMRTVPGLTVLSPSDAGQAIKALMAAIDLNKPVYIRLSGTLNCPVVYDHDYNFEIGRSIKVKEGKDIAIIATGSMVFNAIKAAEILESGTNYSVKVVDMHTIKPLDSEAIVDCFDSTLIVSIEEHNLIGGLGSAISECLSCKKAPPPLLSLGIKDRFSHPGDYEYLLTQNRLTPLEISEDILTMMDSIT